MLLLYDHHFQISFSLKQLSQSKPNFMWSHLGKRKESIYKWSRSQDQDGRHALYGKNLQKSFLTELIVQ